MAPMKLPVLALACLPLLACQNIRSAPEGSPRVEVELILSAADDMFAPFDDEVDRDALRAAFEEAVQPVADVGLRFYPVPSEVYGEDDVRPEYALILELGGIVVHLDHELVEEEGQEPWIRTRVESAQCTVTGTFERRRSNAPVLRVGSEQVTANVRVDPDLEAGLLLAHVTQTGERLHLAEETLRLVYDRAVARVLAKLQKPIDREFEPKGDE